MLQPFGQPISSTSDSVEAELSRFALTLLAHAEIFADLPTADGKGVLTVTVSAWVQDELVLSETPG